ncbi:MAG: cell division protein FtsQ/DivIB, partial [Rubricoccaceae bacterium]
RVRRRGPRARRVLAAAAVAAVLLGAWVWTRTLPVRAVEVVGYAHAHPDALRTLAAVVPGEAALYALRPAEVAARVERHPWVARAAVSRYPTGRLRIRVEEREPVALVLAPDGRPGYYLDAAGYAMPTATASGGSAFDVPLLRGAVPPYTETGPVADGALRALLAALAAAHPAEHALVSEVELGPGGALTLYTTPAGAHGPIRVALSPTDLPDQLARLRAFFAQAVLPQPARTFHLVDLRFSGQIVTREDGPERPFPAPSVPDSLRLRDAVEVAPDVPAAL